MGKSRMGSGVNRVEVGRTRGEESAERSIAIFTRGGGSLVRRLLEASERESARRARARSSEPLLRERIFMLRSRAVDKELGWRPHVANWELPACHPFHNEHGF